MASKPASTKVTPPQGGKGRNVDAIVSDDQDGTQDDESDDELGDDVAGELESPAGDENARALILAQEDGQLVPTKLHAPPRARNDALSRILAEARKYPRLDESEERALIAAVRETGDREAARKLAVHNLRLVVSIAFQYRQAWTNVLDLFQEGSVGIMEAVKRWDPQLGTRFGSYAAYWIRAFILRFLMTNGRLIHVGNTRAGRKLFFRLERERQKLLAQGFDLSPKLLAAHLNVDEKDIEEVSAHLASREVSIDPRPDDDGVSIADRLSGRAPSPESAAARSELAENLGALMARFSDELRDERESAIWREHLTATDNPLSLGELGERFGVSKQRMGQIAEKLKLRFREQVIARFGSDIQLQYQPETDD